MTEARTALLHGALKSGVSAACGLIIALPPIDPEHFSIRNFTGWEHIVSAIIVTVFVAEARFWKQWADSAKEPNP